MTKQKDKPMRKVKEEYCEFCDKIIKGTEKVIQLTDGVSNRVDRIKCLGNAVVPQVAQVIGEMILETLDMSRGRGGATPLMLERGI